jgi:hypothetical protein
MKLFGTHRQAELSPNPSLVIHYLRPVGLTLQPAPGNGGVFVQVLLEGSSNLRSRHLSSIYQRDTMPTHISGDIMSHV